VDVDGDRDDCCCFRRGGLTPLVRARPFRLAAGLRPAPALLLPDPPSSESRWLRSSLSDRMALLKLSAGAANAAALSDAFPSSCTFQRARRNPAIQRSHSATLSHVYASSAPSIRSICSTAPKRSMRRTHFAAPRAAQTRQLPSEPRHDRSPAEERRYRRRTSRRSTFEVLASHASMMSKCFGCRRSPALRGSTSRWMKRIGSSLPRCSIMHTIDCRMTATKGPSVRWSGSPTTRRTART
jgi:hypothetical protein